MRPIIAISILALSAATAFSAHGQDSGNAFFRLQLTAPVLVTEEIGEDVAPPDGDEGNEISISIPSVTDGHVDGRIDGALDIPVLVSGIDETYTVTIADLPGASWVPDGAPHGSGSLVWTPSTTGDWTPVVEVRDADNNLVASQRLELAIYGTFAASTPESIYQAEVGEELVITPTINNAIGNVFWGAIPSPLPDWLELDDTTGNIDVDTSSPNETQDVVLSAVDQFDLASANTTPFSIEIIAARIPCSDPLVIGCKAPDGAIYAGEHEDYYLYAAPADESGTLTWNNGTSNGPLTGAASLTDGLSNTNTLVALSNAGAPYRAAEACRVRGVDWYLPAADELDVLYTNQSAIGGFDDGWTYYWSSSEYLEVGGHALTRRFNNGPRTESLQQDYHPVRCIRREAIPDTSAPIWVTTATLPPGTEGEAYSASIEATDDSGTVTYNLEGSPLAWLALNEETGALSGTPDAAGTVTVTIRAEDPSGNYTDRTFTIEIESAPDTTPPVWSPSGPLQISSIPTPVVGQPYSFQFTATDDSGTVTYHIEGPSGGYPEASYYGTEEGEIGWDQLTLDPETGVLSGTPYMAVSVMPSVYLWAEDSSGNRAFGGVVSGWSIKPAPDTTPPVWQTGSTLPDGIISQQYSTTVSATDENGSVRYELLDAELGRPSIDWLSIDATTGVLSGEAPPMSMSYWVTVRATDAAGNYADRIFSIFINCSGVGACP